MFKGFSDWFRRSMAGRYGSDTLNMVILVGALVMSLLGSILRVPELTLLAWIPMIWAFFRMLSRNVSKRYQENRRFCAFWERLRAGWKHLWDKNYRYFRCPKCRQTVRVPRHKGKISIKCPRCGEKFIKKT